MGSLVVSWLQIMYHRFVWQLDRVMANLRTIDLCSSLTERW
ncbi:hypothetical protein [Candidatus Epulonipiscium viviparus]|nr:hypothetical protein [Candidatus Epulopiscium viviparus]